MSNNITIKDGGGNLIICRSTDVGSGTQITMSCPSDNTGTAISMSNPLFVTESGNSYKNITSATTTACKAASGLLHSVTVNTKAAGSTCVIYDSLTGSGTKIATIDSVNVEVSLIYDVAFLTGLTIVTTGTPDITVSYR